MKNFVNLEKLDEVTKFIGQLKNDDYHDHFLILRSLSLNSFMTKEALKKMYRITEKRMVRILDELKDYISIEIADNEEKCSLSSKGIKLCMLTSNI